MNEDRTGPPKGWYDDPLDRGKRRYWDGTIWTDAVQDRPVAPPPAAPTPASSSKLPRWVLAGLGVCFALVAIWLVVGNGWDTVTGGYTVDIDAVEAEIITGFSTEGVYVESLSCDDPGRVQAGDRSFCDGVADTPGGPFRIQVTYESSGNFVWETY